MTNKTITLPYCRMQVVEVPKDAKDVRVSANGRHLLYSNGAQYLPSGNWQLIGVWPEITTKTLLAFKLIEFKEEQYGILLYEGADGRAYFTGNDFLKHCLTANNLDTSKRWAVLIEN